MTELPLPPDPDPEEVAQGLRWAASFGDLLDLAAAGDLTPEQRRDLNRASQSLERATEAWSDLDAQLAGRAAQKPQRGKIPKRGARTRRDGPRASAGDVADLARKLGIE